MALPSKDLLVPGPWIVNGNTVKDQFGRTIAVCFARNATAHAYWVAEIPRLAGELDKRDSLDASEEIEKLESRIEELERENVQLHEATDGGLNQWDLDNLENENDALRMRVEFLEARVKSLENLVVAAK